MYNHHFVQNEEAVNISGGNEIAFRLRHKPLPDTIVTTLGEARVTHKGNIVVNMSGKAGQIKSLFNYEYML